MSTIPTLPGITSQMIQTERINLHLLSCGPANGVPVLFIHGNASSATFWEEVMLTLPTGFRALAPDLRGYGDTEPLPVDATLGLDDMVDDLLSLAVTLDLPPHHIVGHSMGGGLCQKYLLKNGANVLSMTLAAPMSPYGYSGSRDADGTPCFENDGAPAGAAGVNPDFVRLLGEKYRGEEEQMGPRNVMRGFYFKPPFVPEREEAFLSSMLSMRVGEDHYPGNSVPSENWPGAAPGDKGIVNAFARCYFDASDIINVEPKPPVLWIRGDSDLIVSNNAMFDIQALGQMGFVPGWPEACPAQPMLDQMRAVLDKYAANGGTYEEVVMADTGHSPFVENLAEFNEHFHALLG